MLGTCFDQTAKLIEVESSEKIEFIVSGTDDRDI